MQDLPRHPFDPDDDKLKEECGVFGVIGVTDAANFVALTPLSSGRASKITRRVRWSMSCAPSSAIASARPTTSEPPGN